jgi:outer membrane receptor protein involved in Fe transport
MRTLYIFFCLVWLSSLQTSAQLTTETSSIKGIVIDSASKKGQDYITAALKKENVTIKTALSKSDGSFLIEKVTPGNYTLVVVAMGFSSKSIPLVVSSPKVYDLGKITLASQANNLSEVSVTAARPIIKQDIDRITYDMQADPESKVNTVLDMMRKIPLLSVDAEDNIKLKGSGSYKILINGKPSSLVARNPSDVFKSMPAANIEKIEVITTPPAKYDSEGLAGIINIITKKNIDAGYNGSLNYRHTFPTGGPGGSGSLTVKQGKFGLSAYGGLNKYENPATTYNNSRSTTGTADILPTQLNQDGTSRYDSKFGYFSTELSYEVDTLNLITGEFSFNKSVNNSFSDLSSMLLQGNDPYQSYSSKNSSDNEWKGYDISVNYQKGFKSNKNRLLTLSYKSSNSNNGQVSNYTLSDRFNYSPELFPNYNQYNDGKSNEQTIQADYVHPVGKKLNIEGGLKAILRDNGSVFEYQGQNASGAYVVDSLRTNNFDNQQNVYGAYNSYQYNLTNWGFKAGVRVELTTIDADFVSQSTELDKDFFNVIPSLSINRKFKDMSSLNFGYTQRIERPGIWELNPFVDRSPNFESTGNPDLQPVLNNSFDLNYTRFKKGSINVGLNYSFANNTIQYVSTYSPEDEITRTTFVNTGKDRKFGANFNISYPFTPALNLTLGGNMNYIWLEGFVNGENVKNDGLQGYVYGYMSYKHKTGWRLGGNFSYNSSWITLQGSSKAMLYTSFSLGKDIVKDKLTFSGSVSNPFTKFQAWENDTEGQNFRQHTYSENYSRRFNLSLNWRFGKLKESIKKNQRGISNDDVKSGGGSGAK